MIYSHLYSGAGPWPTINNIIHNDKKKNDNIGIHELLIWVMQYVK